MSIAAILLASSSAAGGIVLLPTTPLSQGSGARTATFRMGSDGYAYNGDNGVYTQQFQWKQSSSPSSDFEVYALVSDGPVSGTTGAWVSLGSNVDWSVVDTTANGAGVIASIVVMVRNASTLEVLATENVDFYADRY